MLKAIPGISKKILVVSIAALFLVSMVFFISPGKIYGDTAIVLVDNLQPSWTASGGGGVWSSYSGPTAYDMVSPGTTALYDGREAGIIKAGLAVDLDGHYWDDGIFGFQPNVTINAFAVGTLTYDVENQYGTNPVWMTIEIDTGVVNDRSDNTVYQFVPTAYPTGWNTVNAAAGQWQKWADNNGTVTGSLMSLSAIAADPLYTGLNVVRAYLRLGMGDPYHGAGSGTIAWVDKATLGGMTYDFVMLSAPTPAPTPSTPPKPLTPEEIASLNLSIGQQIDLYGATNIGFTKMLYDNILGRAAESEGLNNWVTDLNEGKITLGSVVYNFVFSKELESKISAATPEEFITFLYKNVFDRNADPDGYNNWVSLMQNGMSKEDVLLHFIDSGEFKNICEMFGLKP